MKKKLTLSKKELIKLWKEQCSDVNANTILEKSGPIECQMLSIELNNILSIALFYNELKIIFDGQIEYISEKVSKKESEELTTAFLEAEDTIDRLIRDEITSAGIKALENFMDK